MSGFLRKVCIFLVFVAACFAGVRIYAAGNNIYYTYTLNDDGAKTPSVPSSFTIGSVTQLSSLPYKPGYGYAGHYTGQNCTGTQVIDYFGTVQISMNANTTLYACWVPFSPPSIVLDDAGGNGGLIKSNCGSGLYVYETSPVTMMGGYGDWALLINSRGGYSWDIYCGGAWISGVTQMDSLPNRSGFVFKGYYTQPNGGGTQIVYENGNLVNAASVYNVLSHSAPTTIYAKWEQDHSGNYFITLDDAGGSGSQVSSNVFQNYLYEMYGECYAVASGQLPNGSLTGSQCIQSIYQTPTNTGHDFGGYYTGTNGSGTLIINSSGTIVGSNTQFTAPATIHAKWTPKIYTVTLNHQNPTNSPAPSTVYLKHGTGWYSNSGATAPIYSMTTAPIKTNYNFGGYWTGQGGTGTRVIDSDGNFLWTSAAINAITSNTTVYAYWIYSGVSGGWVAVTINDQGATTSSSVAMLYRDTNNVCNGYRTSASCSGSVVTSITPPTKTGYTYGGHWTGVGGTGVQWASNTGTILYDITGDTVVYAKWTPNVYTVTLNNNSGSGTSPTTVYLKYGTGWYSDSAATTSITALTTNPSYTNYLFSGFYNANSGGTQIISSTGNFLTSDAALTAFTSNGTAYARWNTGGSAGRRTSITLNNHNSPSTSYTIYEILNDGWYTSGGGAITASIFDTVANNGAGLSVPTNGTDAFNGYWTAASGGTQVIDENGYILVGPAYSSATTFHAQWTSVSTSAVKFDAGNGNFGTCTDTGVTAIYGQPMPAITCVPSYPGYDFDGYADEEDVMYYDSLMQSAQNWDKAEPESGLVAVWTPASYKVTYYCDATAYSNETQSAQDTTQYNASYFVRTRAGAGCSAVSGSKLVSWKVNNTSTKWTPESIVTYPYTTQTSLVGDWTGVYTITLSHTDADNTPVPTTVYLAYRDGWYSDSAATTPIESMSVVPNRVGYNFLGYWTRKLTAGEQVIDANGNFLTTNTALTALSSNATIYARWSEKNYTIALDDQNATTAGAPTPLYYSISNGWSTTSGGTTITQITTAPTKTGYVFNGYWTQTGGAGTKIINSDRTFASVPPTILQAMHDGTIDTLYADWLIVNTVTFSCLNQSGDGSGTPTAGTTVQIHAGETLTFPAFTGCSWSNAGMSPYNWGYVTNGNFQSVYSPGDTLVWDSGWGNRTFNIQYAPNYFDYEYSCGSGTGTPPTGGNTYYHNGGWSPAANTCSKTGYDFAGWLEPVSNNVYQAGVVPTGGGWLWPYNITATAGGAFTAQWSSRSITCVAGKYLRGSDAACADCTDGNYCPGGTFTFNGSDQGINSCVVSAGSLYTHSGTGTADAIARNDINDCYVTTTAGQYISANNTQTNCPTSFYCPSTDVFYGSTGGKLNCNTGTASGTAITPWTSAASATARTSCYRSVNLNKNGGSGTIQGTTGTTSPATKICYYNTSCEFDSASGLTQDGYTFSGGWASGTSGTCNSVTTSFTITSTDADVNYYACKQGNTITLMYSNGGYGTAPNSNTCVYGSNFTTPSAITGVNGYTFDAWAINGNSFGPDTSVACTSASLGVTSGTATMMAEWGYNAYFVCQNSTISPYEYSGTPIPSEITGIAYQSTITLPSVSVCTHDYPDAGWISTPRWSYSCVDGNGNALGNGNAGASGSFVWPLEGTCTFRPMAMVALYSVTYDCNGGTGNAPATESVSYTNRNTVRPAANTCTAPTGHHFTGWKVDSTNTVLQPGQYGGNNALWPYTENVTLRAQWEPDTYNLTWGCGDGSGTPSGASYPSTITYGATLTFPANTACSVPTGHTFGGWVVDINSTAYQPNGTLIWNYTSGSEINAHFDPVKVNITYSCNGTGGTNPTAQNNIDYGSQVTLRSLGDCVKAGHTATKWNVSNTSPVDSYGLGSTVNHWNYTENKTLTPNWTANIYTITYYDEDGSTVLTGITPSSYTYGNSTTIDAVPTKAHSVFIGWCDMDGSNCFATRTISSTATGNKSFKAKWSCAGGYEKYGFETLVFEYGSQQGNTYPAGSCAPGRYHIHCNGNGGVACLEQLDFGNTGNGSAFHFGQVYGASGLVFADDDTYAYTPVFDVNSVAGSDYIFTETNPSVVPVDLLSTSSFTNAYTLNNYVSFINTIAQSSNVTPWRAHYTFNGLWTDPDEGEGVQYIPANGNVPWMNNATGAEAFSKFFQSDATVYAHWTPDVYTITLNPNKGGDTSGTNGLSAIYERYENGWETSSSGTSFEYPKTLSNAQKPTRDGYTFVGWYDDPTNGVLKIPATGVLPQPNTFGANTTLYAHWTTNTYTVTYACGTGATGNPPANDTVTYNTQPTLPSTTGACAKTGHTLSGWRADGENTNWVNGTTWTYTTNKTFTAQWTANTYTITFHPGNNVTTTGTTEVQEWYGHTYRARPNGSMSWNAITEITLPTRQGYDFAGYYDNSSFTGNPVMTDATLPETTPAATYFAADTDLYAKWTESGYTVTYKNGGGTGSDVVQDVTYNNSFTTKPGTIFTKANSVVTQWNTTSGGNYPNLSTPYPYSTVGNTVLAANWGTCSCTPGTHVDTCSVTGVTDNKCQYSYSCATGYNNGGVSSGTFEGTAGIAVNNSPNCGSGNTYTISYALNGGHYGTSHPVTVTYDTSFTVDNPTHDHATFTGWNITGMDGVTHYYGANGTTTQNHIDGTMETVFKNLHSTGGTVLFTATWNCYAGYTGTNCGVDSYTVTYSCGTGATGTPPTDDTVLYGSTPALPSTQGSCAKVGYDLDGWRANGESTNWTNGTQWTYTTDKTFTAQWTPKSYTMQYVCSDSESGWNFAGTAPTATNPVHYGDNNVTMEADPYNSQTGCRKIWNVQGEYCDNCFTFGGWTIDAESAAIPTAPAHAASSSVNPWGSTGGTDWCIVNTSGLCSGFSANDIFWVRPKYTPKQYDIEYVYATSPANNNASMPASYTYTYATTVDNADQTPPAHATFNGWCTNLNEPSTCVGANQSITIGNREHGNKRYYANWSCDTGYDLSYNANNEPVCSANSVTCDPGEYLPHGTTVCVDCIAGKYCPGGTFTFNENLDQTITVCPTNTYSNAAAAACTACATANGYTNSGPNASDHAYVSSCKTTCSAGQCVRTAGAACVNVGAGGWATGGVVSQGETLTCGACPVGTTTIGYGAGADEANDCGRVLHVGENHVYLRRNRKTDRTLNVKIGNDTYYGNMCPVDINMSDGINHYLKIKLGNTVYSVYDDSAANNCVVPGA